MIFVFVLVLACANGVYASDAANNTSNDTKSFVMVDNSLLNSVIDESSGISNYIKNNHALPNKVQLSGGPTVSSSQYLQLMSQIIQYLNIEEDSVESEDARAAQENFIEELESTAETKIKAAPASVESANSGVINKADYVDMAKRLDSFIKANGRLPNHVDSPIGELGCDVLVYEFSNILNTHKIQGSLPDSINVDPTVWNRVPLNPSLSISIYSLTPDKLKDLQGKAGLDILADYIGKQFNHVTGGPSTAEEVEATGVGDCWGLSDWAARVLRAAGYTLNVIQGPTSASSRHRMLEVLVDGEWIDFDPSKVTSHYGYRYYSPGFCSGSRKVVG